MISLILISCNKNLSPEEFIQWVNNPVNGMVVHENVKEYKISLQYQPNLFLAITNTEEGNRTKELIGEQLLKREGMQYFVLRLENYQTHESILEMDSKTEEDRIKRLSYFDYKMQSDIILVDGLDTLPCLIYHFEKNYSMTPYNSVVLAFDNSKDIENKTLLIDGHVFDTDKIKLEIKKESLINIPRISYD